MLSREITYLKGIGKSRADQFARLGVYTIGDLLRFYPRTYEDRSQIKSIAAASDGEQVCIRAVACSVFKNRIIRRGLSLQKVIVTDGTGVVHITWFNQRWLEKSFDLSKEYTFFGKLTVKNNHLEMSNPVIVKEAKIEPVYPLTEGLTQNIIRGAIAECIDYIDLIPETIPDRLREKYMLCGINYAVRNIHFPEDFEKFSHARRRLVFDELLTLQLCMRLIKERNTKREGIPLKSHKYLNDFVAGLPFPLTNAQKRVTKEIISDISGTTAMSRLVQGDVGSGKTIVAAAAMLVVAENGYQSALMAPTEILAEQHFETIAPLMERYGFECVLLTGGMTAQKKREALSKIESGEAKIVIGTHAVIQKGVEFKNIALVVTDEQHRFGVKQRSALEQKGVAVHSLIMTATPIPRTLAHILYGDLDVSLIDELPPGRKLVKTYAVDEGMRTRINNFILKELKSGRQVYVVCPLVEESETIDLTDAVRYSENMQKLFPEYRVGLMHGRLKSREKEEIMKDFSDKKIDILVSTTVIEVGVNVPNASLMIIENAERFGLAQLHQLRGRVGRGEHQSYCVMFNQGGGVSSQRMKIMQQTSDGFKIAEKDLEIRGPGEIFGTRQHGLPEFKIANLYYDMPITTSAGKAADEILILDEKLENTEHQALREEIEKKLQNLLHNYAK